MKKHITFTHETGSRTVTVNNLPEQHLLPEPLRVTIDYVRDNTGATVHKAVAVDNDVIPRVIECLDACENLTDPRSVLSLTKKLFDEMITADYYNEPLNIDMTSVRKLRAMFGPKS